MGFPPRGGEAREEWFARLGDDERTLVFFESPHRIKRTLTDLQPYLVNRPILIARELSKVHEQLVISPNKALAISETGEFTIVVSPAIASEVERSAAGDEAVLEIFWRITNIGGFDEPSAIRLTASATNLKATTVRKLVKKSRISAERQNRSVS